MATTPVTNFGKVQVSIGYDSAATSVALISGHGSRLPSTFPYPLTWWNATDYSDPADDPNVEIILVSVRTGDTLSTIVRGQEGTTATAKNIGGKTYKMVLGVTKGMWDALADLSLAQTFRNLQLQSHPDSDKVFSQVRLVHADAIVMSDGEEVPNWDDVDFNIAAAAGIGGLDTGTEQPSTWYKIHAMWNGTTKGLMGQRAKNYKLDASYLAGEDASQGLRSNVDNSTVKVAQGLQFATAGLLEFIDLKLLKTGTPTGNFWVTIEANSGGVPSNTPLATSDKFDVSALLTTAIAVRLPFRTPFSVSAATQYHLVLQGDFAVSGSNFMSVRMDGSAGSYASGSKALFDSDTSTWTTDTDDDLWFEAFVTENDVALVVPAGYRSAHIGWACNDSGSALVLFRQKDHSWHYTHLSQALFVNETAAAVTLYPLSTLVPPITGPVRFMLTGTGAAVAQIVFGDIKMPHMTVNFPYTTSLVTGGISEDIQGETSLILEYSAVYLAGTAGADVYIPGFEW